MHGLGLVSCTYDADGKVFCLDLAASKDYYPLWLTLLEYLFDNAQLLRLVADIGTL